MSGALFRSLWPLCKELRTCFFFASLPSLANTIILSTHGRTARAFCLVVLMAPCVSSCVVRARNRALRWSAGRPRRWIFLPCRIMVHLQPLSTPRASVSAGVASGGQAVARKSETNPRGCHKPRHASDSRLAATAAPRARGDVAVRTAYHVAVTRRTSRRRSVRDARQPAEATLPGHKQRRLRGRCCPAEPDRQRGAQASHGERHGDGELAVFPLLASAPPATVPSLERGLTTVKARPRRGQLLRGRPGATMSARLGCVPRSQVPLAVSGT